MNDLFNRLNALFTRIQDKKLTEKEKFTITSGLVILSVILALFTIKFWLGPVVFLGLIVFLVADSIKPDNPQPHPPFFNNAIMAIYQCIFSVVMELTTRGNLLPIQRPIDIEDIHVVPEIGYKFDLPFVKIRLLKKANYNDEADTPQIIKKVLQFRINSRLRSGSVEGVPYPSFDGKYPIIWIDEIRDEGLFFILEVFWVDNDPAVIRYLNHKNHKATKPPTSPEDRDF